MDEFPIFPVSVYPLWKKSPFSSIRTRLESRRGKLGENGPSRGRITNPAGLPLKAARFRLWLDCPRVPVFGRGEGGERARTSRGRGRGSRGKVEVGGVDDWPGMGGCRPGIRGSGAGPDRAVWRRAGATPHPLPGQGGVGDAGAAVEAVIGPAGAGPGSPRGNSFQSPAGAGGDAVEQTMDRIRNGRIRQPRVRTPKSSDRSGRNYGWA